MLDHAAKPPLREREVDAWLTDLRRVAANDNVVCKISGLVTEASWEDWRASDIRRCLDEALACFGPERLMFGSDWPVVTLAARYDEWFRFVTEWFDGLPESKKGGLWGETAARVYRLEDEAFAE